MVSSQYGEPIGLMQVDGTDEECLKYCLEEGRSGEGKFLTDVVTRHRKISI